MPFPIHGEERTLDVVLKRGSGDQQLGGTPETLERLVKLRLVILKSMCLFTPISLSFRPPLHQSTKDLPHQQPRPAI